MKNQITYIGMAVLILIAIEGHSQSGLFISEVADPGDEYTARFIELFNAGSETVDFGNEVFYLTRQSNGGTSWGKVQLTGSVAPGQTYVIGGSAFESFYGFVPDLVTGILTGNGDDPYSLYSGGDHETGMIHDIYGEKNTDGTGEAWEYTDSRAVRTSDVDDPRILWSSSEWTITPADVADCDPGIHHGSGGGGPIIPSGDFALAVVSDTVEEGDPFSVAIAVSELESRDDVISYQFDVNYDPAIMTYMYSSINGTMADGGTVVDNQPAAGVVAVSFMHTEAMTGAGTLLHMHFEPLGIGTGEIVLSDAFLNNISVDELHSGSIMITETSPPVAHISYSDSINRLSDMLQITAVFSEPMAVENPVHLHMSGAVSESGLEMVRTSDTTYSYLYFIPRANGVVDVRLGNGTDMRGNEVLAMPASGASFMITGLNPGDVNDDGHIQAYDAALTLQHSVGLDPLPEADPLPWEPWRDSTANVDRSGAITAYDAGLILQFSAGIISGFPASARKRLAETGIRMHAENGSLRIVSTGEVIGLNLFADASSAYLGAPSVKEAEYLSAFNIGESVYRIGICAAEPPPAGTELLAIPVLEEGTVLVQVNVNGEQYDELISISTRIATATDAQVNVYPNPVQDRLMVETPGKGVVVILLYDARGTLLRRIETADVASGIDVSDLKQGTYFLRIETTGGVITRKVVKD